LICPIQSQLITKPTGLVNSMQTMKRSYYSVFNSSSNRRTHRGFPKTFSLQQTA